MVYRTASGPFDSAPNEHLWDRFLKRSAQGDISQEGFGDERKQLRAQRSLVGQFCSRASLGVTVPGEFR